MIAIVDYGAGNLRSVQNTLEELGYSFEVIHEPERLVQAEKAILPGVGHFGAMMTSLKRAGLDQALVEFIRSGRPFLGICLGLQALFEASEEAPGTSGLGIFPGKVQRFPAHLRVPHMGWNQLEQLRESRLLKNVELNPYVYFAHSYYVPLVPQAAASCTYGVTYTALVEQENVFGVQFHPEKSGPVGLLMMQNFLEL